ncbi:sugar dehydrogenase complex small subunit [Acetobacteraceae bacterium ESL0709]|nr:sugar dehydrogenase complex small subunit [Acetobacteraceae bacterium ESL0697]MDF7678165.1 sugar dehydrogenase complex small subunit [Acetobacteraceae bacterium ESL0709]
MSVSRRQLLIALATVPPSALFLAPAIATPQKTETDKFLKVSQVITGNRHLNKTIAQRIENTLEKRIPDFASRLESLASVLSVSGDRDDLLRKLTASQTDFAFEIAKPWYLGFIGTPKGDALNDDDAEFVTYLHAQSYELVKDELPRPGYPPKARGWWKMPPPNMEPAQMPDDISDWTVQQNGAHGHIVAADEEWRAYALGQTDIKPS